mmetsp:Transcript_30748/g.89323  ORF Transcript_30748/g.89323 Transcript_30748/m.89323 type:complete len:212 (-) Transcript_30748:74-709(-)
MRSDSSCGVSSGSKVMPTMISSVERSTMEGTSGIALTGPTSDDRLNLLPLTGGRWPPVWPPPEVTDGAATSRALVGSLEADAGLTPIEPVSGEYKALSVAVQAQTRTLFSTPQLTRHPVSASYSAWFGMDRWPLNTAHELSTGAQRSSVPRVALASAPDDGGRSSNVAGTLQQNKLKSSDPPTTRSRSCPANAKDLVVVALRNRSVSESEW